MTAEKRISEQIKEMKNKNLELGEFIELVHDLINDIYGYNVGDVSVKKGKNGWTLEFFYEDEFFDGYNVRDCYEQLYIFILEEQLREELENEAYLAEQETRASYDRWYNENNGVPYGRY